MSETATIDPIRLEILWNRLISAVNEQAATLVRTAFSPVTRDAGDYGAGVFDRRGRMVATAVKGTPGHIAPMSNAVKAMLARHDPATIEPGDVLVTNDPWLNSGHLNDVMILSPVFRAGRLVAFFGSLCHATDIGGRGIGAEARDAYEEGLRLPPMKLVRAGTPSEDVYELLRANVRFAATVLADFDSQMSANDVGGQRLLEILEEYDVDFDALADAIISASRAATEAAIRRIPDGSYPATTLLDPIDKAADSETGPIELRATLTISGGTLTVDYTGTTSQVLRGINVTLNYTHAYTTFAVRCLLVPDVPNNDGSLEPIQVAAPPGTILSATFPAPVSMRHIVGMFVPFTVIRAVADVLPERVMADGSGATFGAFFSNAFPDAAQEFAAVYLACGGMGARADKDGLSATGYPTGITAIPVEVVEKQAPLVIWRKELVANSGGDGRFRGGLGQRIEIGARTGEPWAVNAMVDRQVEPAQGMFGGEAGATGSIATSTGRSLDPMKRLVLEPDERLIVTLSGGGGFGDPDDREPALREQDALEGLVTDFEPARS